MSHKAIITSLALALSAPMAHAEGIVANPFAGATGSVQRGFGPSAGGGSNSHASGGAARGAGGGGGSGAKDKIEGYGKEAVQNIKQLAEKDQQTNKQVIQEFTKSTEKFVNREDNTAETMKQMNEILQADKEAREARSDSARKVANDSITDIIKMMREISDINGRTQQMRALASTPPPVQSTPTLTRDQALVGATPGTMAASSNPFQSAMAAGNQGAVPGGLNQGTGTPGSGAHAMGGLTDMPGGSSGSGM